MSASLCQACGLCCDGTLFARVKLDSGEVAQPCPHHAGTSCSIYEKRPAVCSRYECSVLKDVRAGRMALSSALELVDAARADKSLHRHFHPPRSSHVER